MNNHVRALAVHNGDLIVGGTFTTAGGTSTPAIARWNGSSWSSLGAGIQGSVESIIVYNGNVVVAGGFNTAGGLPAKSIASWNGLFWSPLGSGITGIVVNALAVYNGDLIAAGIFREAGGVPVNSIARWNGSAWQPLGQGVGNVNALTVFQGSLIAGGNFSNPDGVVGVARWNGTSWSSLGGGITGFVETMAVYRGNLVVAGTLGTAGGTTHRNIAKWNGGSWSSFGEGLGIFLETPTVNALGVFSNEIVAGGEFNWTGSEVVVSNIARWNDLAVAYPLDIYLTGTGAGYIFSDIPGITCGSACRASYTDGSIVTLNVPPPPFGNVFTGWGGACSGTELTCTVLVNSPRQVVANFNSTSPPSTYPLSVFVSGSGSVSSSPGGISCGSTCTATFARGSTVSLTASPGSGGHFIRWEGGCSGSGLTCSLPVNQALNVHAVFVQPLIFKNGFE